MIKLTKVERKRMGVVAICLLLAAMAWLFMALSSKYLYISKTVMVYKNLPQNRAFQALQSDTIDLQVEGTGWQLLFSKFRVNPTYINIDLRPLAKQNFVVFSEQAGSINKQLETSQKIVAANPDTLYFDFSKSFEKKIPIRLVSQLTFMNQYSISDAIELKPKFVTVRGPKEVLSGLKEWKTDTLKLFDLNQTTSLRVPLTKTALKNVTIFPNVVEVNLPVEEFTEKTLELPLKIYNNKTFLDVNVFPKKVKVTFLVSLSHYTQVDVDFIEVGVDLNDWKQKGHGRLSVNLTRFPDYCKLVKIEPAIVDFLIEK